MELKLESDKQVWHTGEAVTVRLVALNNSCEVATLDRRLLVGPNPLPGSPVRSFPEVSLEPAFSNENGNFVLLNPRCFYGRQRTFENVAAGQLTLYGYLLNKPVDALLPKGPADPDALDSAADSLVLTVID
jgi:hypothetical protein